MSYTEDQIKEKISGAYTAYEAMPGNGYCEMPQVEVISNHSDQLVVKLHAMYECPPFNSVVVQMLCDAFGTKHIDELDHYSEGGCESCDYGSDYGFTLRIKLGEQPCKT